MTPARQHWTALGVPDSPLGPVVDGGGLLTPFAHGWSVEVGVVSDGTLLTPSDVPHVQQRALDGFPVILTAVTFQEGVLHLVTFADASAVHLEASLDGCIRPRQNCSLVFSVRRSEPEGAAVINSIEYLPDRKALRVNDAATVLFNAIPDQVHCSTGNEGDALTALGSTWQTIGAKAARCAQGSASAIALFLAREDHTESFAVRASIPLRREASPLPSSPPIVLERWKQWLAGTAEILTPDARLNGLVRLSLATLAMSCTGEAGGARASDNLQRSPHVPVMALALEMFGVHDHTGHLLRSMLDVSGGSPLAPNPEDDPGFTAQLARLAWHHLLLTGDRTLLEELSSSIMLRTRSVLQARGSTGSSTGAGEPDAWSFAGLEASARIAELLGTPQAVHLKRQLTILRNDLPQALMSMLVRGAETLDKLCAACTLQLLDASDPRLSSAIDMVFRRSLPDGTPPEPGAYLLSQAAHACLLAGRRRESARLLSAAAAVASPTGSFASGAAAEAGGTSAGSGRAGLAAAAFVLALRDGFVFERQEQASGFYDLVFLAGLKPEWFEEGPACALKNAPVHGGRVSLEVHPGPGHCKVQCRWEHLWFAGPRHFVVELPPGIEPLECRGWISLRQGAGGGTALTLPPESFTLTVRTPAARPARTESAVA